MLKFIKRLFLLSSLLLIGGGIWGYNNGMTTDNYQEFISETIEKYQPKQTIAKIEIKEEPAIKEKPTPVAKPKKREVKKEKPEPLSIPTNPFLIIDKHARNSSSTDEIDVQTLADYLQQKAQTDLEKARAIYVWLAENIRYDDETFNSGDYPDYTPQYLLDNRKAICDGYGNLYLALGLEMGLKIEKVTGYAKGYGYKTGSKLGEENLHSWNIIKIDGQWKIFDATWGRGYGESVAGKLVSTKKFEDYWFDVSPYKAIFNHYTDHTSFLSVEPTISLSQYEQLPNIKNEYFKLGFDDKETFFAASSNSDYETPLTYSIDTYVRLLEAPKVKNLHVAQSYDFEFYIPAADKVAAIDSKGKWTYFKRKNGKFQLSLTPKETGKLQISVHHKKKNKAFDTVLIYEVNDEREAS